VGENPQNTMRRTADRSSKPADGSQGKRRKDGKV
jgi:hypothetical protein